MPYYTNALFGTLMPSLIACVAAALISSCAQAEPKPIETLTNKISGILATHDLSVGYNRVSFLLTDQDALITNPVVELVSIAPPNNMGTRVIKQKTIGLFYLWPYGLRGNYAAQLTFDQPGDWHLEINVLISDGSTTVVHIPLRVNNSSITPGLGTIPPLTKNKTFSGVESSSELTSGDSLDPDLYQTTISDAIISGIPSVIAFASPSLCTSPTCGPQVETLSNLKERYKNRANFIHVEIYDNPHEMKGDLAKAQYSTVVDAWGLRRIKGYINESWVFVLDNHGRIVSKYEGFVSVEEIDWYLRELLEKGIKIDDQA